MRLKEILLRKSGICTTHKIVAKFATQPSKQKKVYLERQTDAADRGVQNIEAIVENLIESLTFDFLLHCQLRSRSQNLVLPTRLEEIALHTAAGKVITIQIKSPKNQSTKSKQTQI